MTIEKTKLLHIGYPKCMSTTLQRDFFAKHPEIDFWGCGRAGSAHGWLDDQLAALCEGSLRYENSLHFDMEKSKGIFSDRLKTSNDNDATKVICLSSESFSFTMHFDVDPVIKANRLKELLGKDTKILFVIRNQLDLFKSYYYECVRSGYCGYFDDFINYHYHYQFHSILSDMTFHPLYKVYCDLFGEKNIKVIPMESLIDNPAAVLSELCSHVGISKMDLSLGQHNESNDKKYLQALRLLNEKFPNNCGSGYFGWVDTEKLGPYWSEKQRTPDGKYLEYSYGTRMMIYRAANSVISDFVNPLEANYTTKWSELLASMYRQDNAVLAKATGLDLESLGYPH